MDMAYVMTKVLVDCDYDKYVDIIRAGGEAALREPGNDYMIFHYRPERDLL